MKASAKYSHVKAKVDTNLQGRKWPQASLKSQMKQAKPVKADEERPISTYVQINPEEAESDEREDECKKFGLPFEELQFRKLQNLPLVKYKADD